MLNEISGSTSNSKRRVESWLKTQLIWKIDRVNCNAFIDGSHLTIYIYLYIFIQCIALAKEIKYNTV